MYNFWRALPPYNALEHIEFKIWRDFSQLQSLTANISGTDGDTDKR